MIEHHLPRPADALSLAAFVSVPLAWWSAGLDSGAFLLPRRRVLELLDGGAVLWEAGEWIDHRHVSEETGVGYDDTVVDVMLGGLDGRGPS